MISYVYFGTTVWYLTTVEEGATVKGRGRVLFNMTTFLEGLDELDLQITKEVARNEQLPQLKEELAAVDEGTRLTDDQATRLNEAMANLRRTLNAEAVAKKAFIVSPKRWDVDKLLHEPSEMFAPKVYAELSDIGRFDFAEAFKCIAFERATGAAFHLMRGVEGVLRDFYSHVVRRGRLAEKDRMWGAMVEGLRARRGPPPAALLDELDNIRNNYRNPTQHPDATYDIHEAQDLLGVSVGVVNPMVIRMR